MHTDITASYLGLHLRSPLLVGACPMTLVPETVRELTIAGAGAIVLPSVIEETIVRRVNRKSKVFDIEHMDTTVVPAVVPARLENQLDPYNGDVRSYLRTVGLVKNCTGVPVIANLNGYGQDCWPEFASRLEQAGADAIELTIETLSSDPGQTSQDIESKLTATAQKICNSVSIPVSVKLLPFFTSLPNLAIRLADAGVRGIVLFGRQPTWEVKDESLTATSRWTLSDAGQLQTTLSGLMRLHSGIPQLSIAASGGISTAKDAIHAVVAGADVTMVTSEIYRSGPDVIAHILDGLIHYLERQRITSFTDFVSGCRSHVDREQTRHDPSSAMLDLENYRDFNHEPALQTGDRWGHVYPAPPDG